MPTGELKVEGAKRFDMGKLRWDLLDLRSIREVVKVYTFGAKKYDDHNWKKGMSWSRVLASLQRHLYAFWAEKEMYDKESGCHHLAHAAWNCLTLMWYSWFRRALDDRPNDTSDDGTLGPDDNDPVMQEAMNDTLPGNNYAVRDVCNDVCCDSEASHSGGGILGGCTNRD